MVAVLSAFAANRDLTILVGGLMEVPSMDRRRSRQGSRPAGPLQPRSSLKEAMPLREALRALAPLWQRDEQEGQGLAEYALILGLIAIVTILSLIFLGDVIGDLMSFIGTEIDKAANP